MRVTVGNMKRRYLYDCRLGSRRIVRKMKAGRQIWPTLSDLVRYAVLDMSPLEGALEGAYWAHALSAVSASSSASRYMQVEAGGKVFLLLSSFGQYDVAGFEHATLDFGDYGPLATSFGVGDEVVVTAVVPRRELSHAWYSYNAMSSLSYDVPFLPGMALRVRVQKGQKRVSAGVNYALRGVSSGVGHIVGDAKKNGHCRGQYWGTAYAAPGRVIDGWVSSYVASYRAGDSGLLLQLQGYYGGQGEAYVIVPAFTRVFRLRVLDVVRHG